MAKSRTKRKKYTVNWQNISLEFEKVSCQKSLAGSDGPPTITYADYSKKGRLTKKGEVGSKTMSEIEKLVELIFQLRLILRVESIRGRQNGPH